MAYSTRITTDTAQRIIDLSHFASKVIDAGDDNSTLTLKGHNETLIARWDDKGNIIVDLVRHD